MLGKRNFGDDVKSATEHPDIQNGRFNLLEVLGENSRGYPFLYSRLVFKAFEKEESNAVVLKNVDISSELQPVENTSSSCFWQPLASEHQFLQVLRLLNLPGLRRWSFVTHHQQPHLNKNPTAALDWHHLELHHLAWWSSTMFSTICSELYTRKSS